MAQTILVGGTMIETVEQAHEQIKVAIEQLTVPFGSTEAMWKYLETYDSIVRIACSYELEEENKRRWRELGRFKDDSTLLQKAIEYLEVHEKGGRK